MDTLVLVEVHRYPLHNLYLYFSTHNLNLHYIVIFAHFWSDMYTDDCFWMMHEAQLPC